MAKGTLIILCICIGVALGFRTWPNKRVPYVVDASLGGAETVIRGALDGIESKTCIKFVKRQASDPYYLQFKKGSYCSAHQIGFNRKNIISLTNYCLKGFNTIQYETSNSLGLKQPPTQVGTGLTDDDYTKLKKMYNC